MEGVFADYKSQTAPNSTAWEEIDSKGPESPM
jgi:hypothetical protein